MSSATGVNFASTPIILCTLIPVTFYTRSLLSETCRCKSTRTDRAKKTDGGRE